MEKKILEKKRGKVGKKKCKKKGKSTVDYYCNPQWFRCGETVIPPHHLDIVSSYMTHAMPWVNFFNIKNIKKN